MLASPSPAHAFPQTFGTTIGVLVVLLLAPACTPDGAPAPAAQAAPPDGGALTESDAAPSALPADAPDAGDAAPPSCATSPCGTHSHCADAGACVCDDGYHLENGACVDVDECAASNGGCDPRVPCSNTAGSFSCGACPAGYRGDGKSGCHRAPARLVSASPTMLARDTDTVVKIGAVDLVAGAVAYLDGTACATTVVDATQAEATVNVAPGLHRLTVRTDPNDPESESNGLLVRTRQPSTVGGSIAILGFIPTWGVAGDTIRVLGAGIADMATTLVDPNGLTAPATQTWAVNINNVNYDAVDFTLPAGWVSGRMSAKLGADTAIGPWFEVGTNLASAPGSAVGTNSYPEDAYLLVDADLWSSWSGDTNVCASAPACTKAPVVNLFLDKPQPVRRVVLRGDRSSSATHQILAGKIELLDGNATLVWGASRAVDRPSGDLELMFSPPLANVSRIRFTGELDASSSVALAEIEVF